MKSVRVKLMKQVKEESERFRALKTEKNKEILQLKEKVWIRPLVQIIILVYHQKPKIQWGRKLFFESDSLILYSSTVSGVPQLF